MSWKACGFDEHEWESLPRWGGRYKCRKCYVLGYRAGAALPALLAEAKGPGSILPYKCPKCHGPTTGWRKKRVGEFGVRDGAQLCPRCV